MGRTKTREHPKLRLARKGGLVAQLGIPSPPSACVAWAHRFALPLSAPTSPDSLLSGWWRMGPQQEELPDLDELMYYGISQDILDFVSNLTVQTFRDFPPCRYVRGRPFVPHPDPVGGCGREASACSLVRGALGMPRL